MSPLMLDAVLAYAHYIGIGLLVTFLAVETALVRDGMTADHIMRVARIDIGIGAAATLILFAGFGRVLYGLKGPAYYLGSHVFWTKMALFILAALASLPPTIQYLRWRKSLRADPAFRPDAAKVRMVRGHIIAEWVFLALIPVAAVLMARGVGL
jgi:putative membrane protein